MKLSFLIALILAGLLNHSSSDMLQQEIDRVHAQYAKVIEKGNKKLEDQIEHLKLPQQKFVCSGGVDPKKMPIKDYLSAFAKSTCSPFAIIPPLTGSKLIAEVNCEVIKAQRPAIFKTCGWTSCGGEKSPKDFYMIWIPAVDSDVSIVSPFTKKSNECFAYFMGYDIKKVSSSKINFVDRPGFTVKVIGESENTKYSSECGFDASQNMLPLGHQYGTQLFGILGLRLEAYGYIKGLTLQNIPYDWRVSYRESNMNTKFWPIIQDMNAITGKKVSVIGHSYGNNMALHLFYSQKQSVKDKLIERYYGIGAPFLGSAQAVSVLLTYETALGNFMRLGIGFDVDMSTQMFPRFKSIYELLPQEPADSLKSTVWFKEMYKRIEADQAKIVYKSTHPVLKLFPPRDQKCFIFYKGTQDVACSLGAHKFNVFGSVEKQIINSKTMGSILGKYGEIDGMQSIYDETRDSRFSNLQNPGVQMNLLYFANILTVSEMHFSQNPRKFIKENKPYNPEKVVEVPGDVTVEGASTLIPGIKWADDFNKKVSGAKPVSFIELGSLYQQRDQLAKKGKGPTENQYFGLNSDCGRDGTKCDHAHELIDGGFVDFMSNTLVNASTGSKPSGKFASMTEAKWVTYLNKCQLLLRDF